MTHEHGDRRAPESEVEECWQDFWLEIVMPQGILDLEQVKKELHDFHGLLREVPVVYDHVTNGRVSKPHTKAFEVTRIYDEERQPLEEVMEIMLDVDTRCHVQLNAINRSEGDHDPGPCGECWRCRLDGVFAPIRAEKVNNA
jgi:hypothetical protein